MRRWWRERPYDEPSEVGELFDGAVAAAAVAQSVPGPVDRDDVDTARRQRGEERRIQRAIGAEALVKHDRGSVRIVVLTQGVDA